jgi:single-stranded DNA-binding protein
MSSLNRVMLIGRLTRNPDIGSTPSASPLLDLAADGETGADSKLSGAGLDRGRSDPIA